MLGTSSWELRDGEQIIACNRSLLGHRHFLIGITRVRNEALILRDTLDYVGKHVDAIVAYDDASPDQTLEILGGHPKVGLIGPNRPWEGAPGDLGGIMEPTLSSYSDGVGVQLFEAFMAPADHAPYKADCELLNFR